VTDEPRSVEIDENDMACIIYTSGTTGASRGAMFSHRKIIHNASLSGALNHRFNFCTRSLIMMPLFHSAPLHNHMLGTFFVGGTCVLLDHVDCRLFLETIQKEKTTHFFGPAMIYRTCVMEYDLSRYDLSSMELFVMGGSPCSPEDMAAIISKMKLEGRLMQVYGLTEGGPVGTALEPEDASRKMGALGINGSVSGELVIVDKDFNQIQEPDVVGEIVVHVESCMSEYYGDPEKTAQNLRNGWIMTGDLARYDEDGYVYFVDRIKDMIISGGQNIYSKEVEDVIMLHPAVQAVAVIGIPHAKWGESVKAIVSPLPGKEISPHEIKEFCTDKLAKFKHPRHVQIIETLPRNPAGKILKSELREQCSEAVDSAL
jgi:acyl-CoA synthetase (AMP-forming)/AMP-acid ligase II